MNISKKHWGIVGGGMLGMYLAHKLSQAGHEVTLMEAANAPGGLTSTWKLDQYFWDKYYHVILRSDTTLRNLLKEIGLEETINWVETKTGFYTGGKLYSMSNTMEFLRFPPLSILDKLRLGFTIFYASKIKNWKRLENIRVADWLKKWSGSNTFEKIWLPLLRAKLGDNYQHTSAAFIWTTIQRMYKARRTGLKKEMFGYVEGGYATILKRFKEQLIQQGVHVKTAHKVTCIYRDYYGNVMVETAKNQPDLFNEVIVTTPSSIAAEICKDLLRREVQQHQNIEYLGVICASLLLKKSISPYYVTNVTDKSPFTGIIEMTNIVDPEFFGGNSLIYLPRYAKSSNPIFHWNDEQIKTLFLSSLLNMYPHLSEEDVVAFRVSRAPYVFALPTLKYSEKLPAVSTSLPGVHILNSAHIVNGTLNVNETLQVVDKALPELLKKAINRKTEYETYA